MKVSRRDLAALAATTLLVPNQRAQTPPDAPNPDPVKAARETVQRNSEALAKFEVPIATEPAFQFKP